MSSKVVALLEIEYEVEYTRTKQHICEVWVSLEAAHEHLKTLYKFEGGALRPYIRSDFGLKREDLRGLYGYGEYQGEDEIHLFYDEIRVSEVEIIGKPKKRRRFNRIYVQRPLFTEEK